jgi:drug/metabolite transporter (DMT)-like permease
MPTTKSAGRHVLQLIATTPASHRVPESPRRITDPLKARLLLVGLCLAWGLTWPAMRIALIDFPPFTMRALAAFIGVTALVVLARVAGRPVRLPPKSTWAYIIIISFLNIIVFSVCAAFAQLSATTGRVAILVYTMPIWASLLAWLFLGERLNAARALALLLCCVGMVVLIYPLTSGGIPGGLLLSLCAAVSWALGTIYMKKSRIDIDPYTLAACQLAVAFVVILALVLIFERSFEFSTVHLNSWLGVIFSGLFGSAVAYYLWFKIIRLMPATTASLGALSSPVIGVVSSTILLNEWPTTADIFGFTLIFSASVCALLQPQIPVPVLGRK